MNHYAYGAVAEWMYRVIGGVQVDPAEPAYAVSIGPGKYQFSHALEPG